MAITSNPRWRRVHARRTAPMAGQSHVRPATTVVAQQSPDKLVAHYQSDRQQSLPTALPVQSAANRAARNSQDLGAPEMNWSVGKDHGGKALRVERGHRQIERRRDNAHQQSVRGETSRHFANDDPSGQVTENDARQWYGGEEHRVSASLISTETRRRAEDFSDRHQNRDQSELEEYSRDDDPSPAHSTE